MSFPERDEDGFGLEQVAAATDVSRETLDLIRHYLFVLDDWRTKMNLIGPAEGRHLWRRHVYDSLQVLDLIGKGRESGPASLVDLGSGAGFPGIVLACVFAGSRSGHGDISVTLVEKSPKKAHFLESAVRAVLGAKGPVVLNQRIEDAPAARFDIVTARALAPLPKLLGYVESWAKPDGQALLWKGREATSELTLSREFWTFDFSQRASLTHPEGQVLAISNLRRQSP
ncbi:MAG: 16S rRNA (guanine(527)-N(7))-methyltransferase RsmG [Alphaproteobacteria bacterium]